MQDSEKNTDSNKFQIFFEDDNYIILKNSLYNYRLRQWAINRNLRRRKPFLILEVGSGISPVVTHTDHIVYSEMSFTALRYLKETQKTGMYVVADGTALPFKSGIFSDAVCSEVLEHIPEDQACLTEMNRVLKTDAGLIITVPHRNAYFGIDDLSVGHHRRYELAGIIGKLKGAGFRPQAIQKILGPLEKLTMWLLFCLIAIIKKRSPKTSAAPKTGTRPTSLPVKLLAPIFKWSNSIFMLLVWADARLFPLSMSTVLLISATSSGKPTNKRKMIDEQ